MSNSGHNDSIEPGVKSHISKTVQEQIQQAANQAIQEGYINDLISIVAQKTGYPPTTVQVVLQNFYK